MASVNKVTLIGNLGRDPELRHTPDGIAVCNVSIATTSQWKDKETGADRYSTEIVADQMQMLGGRGEDGGQAPQRAARPAAPAAAPAGNLADMDDDIPF